MAEHDDLLAIFDGIDEPVYVADTSTHEILFVNRALGSLFGPPGARRCYEYLQGRAAPCPFCTNDRILGEHMGRSYIWEFRNEANGRWYKCIDKAIPWPDGRLVRYEMAIDVTDLRRGADERERLSQQLAQAQKMESVGRLAGGIAHDFNNMLAVIIGYAELALDRIPPSDPLAGELGRIRAVAERSAELTRQLLAFARKQTVVPRMIDLNATLEGMLQMLRRLIGEGVELRWLPGGGAGRIRFDLSQLNQILVNLCLNARDAVGDSGRITVETGGAAFDDAYCAGNAGYLPGAYALLAVSDDGCGMDAETRARLFEPYFTTKDPGKGTGLGLSTVYGAVRQSGGFLSVYSEPGRGTTFKVYLPRSAEEPARAPGSEAGERPAAGGGETVLLVEDEPLLRDVAQRMLEASGYAVVPAATPGEALRLAGEPGARVDLLLTDVVMPGMSGSELAERIRALHPGAATLFMSGYTPNVVARHGVPDGAVHFLQKPFSLSELAAKAREALGG